MPHRNRAHRAAPGAALLLLLAALAGCQGAITRGDPSGPSGADPAGRAADGVFDPDDPQGRLAAPVPSHGPLSIRVEETGSSSITVTWDEAEGAAGYDVSIGPEPPTGDDGVLPLAEIVGSVDAATRALTIDGIAASTDLFVRVEARDSAEPAFGVLHARTEGGPMASLSTPLRSVHAFGPSTLMLVLADDATRYDRAARRLDGDDGAAWAGGTWTVERSDGTAIGVTAVHRASRPFGQPEYPVGFEAFGDDDVIDVEHEIFLVLDQPLGSRDLLRVRHEGAAATGLDVRVPFSDRYLETPLLQVNQVGYNPRATARYAYVAGWMGTGGGAPLSDIPAEAHALIEPVDPIAARLPASRGLAVTDRAANDAESGSAVKQIDMSSVPPAEGRRYRIHLPGIGVSWPTAVSEEASMRTFYTVARGMFHNRWCGDLGGDATEWSRPQDHCSAFFVTGRSYEQTMFTSDTPQRDERPVRGGHHDAGDFDIRPFHVLVGQYMLRAFEMDPSRFSDGQLTVPESGNGIPDLLDEALWSLQAWLDLQNPDGSIRAGVESYRHPAGIYKANEDELPYWTFDPVPWHTAYVAALFAQASRLVRPYDAAKSAELEAAARGAYGSGVAAAAPAAYRMYAASELTALTGDRRFAADFEARWAELDRFGRGAFDHQQSMIMVYPGSFRQGFAMADFVMGYAESDVASAAVVGVIRTEIGTRADAAAAALLDSPHAHRNGRNPRDTPDWGHTNSTGRHADYIYQALELGDLSEARRQRYFDAMSIAADYALGCNPMGIVYLTGLGSRSPLQPLHLDSLAFAKDGMPPVPGIPVYGPVNTLPGTSYYDPVRTAFVPSFDARPLGRHYADSRTSVNTAEFTVWESQAPFTQLFSALVAPSMEPPSTWLPRGISHRATMPEHWAD